MAMLSPGRMGVGWETISLIEGKGLNRYFQAVDQRERERDGEREVGSTILFSFHYQIMQPRQTSNYVKGLKKS